MPINLISLVFDDMFKFKGIASREKFVAQFSFAIIACTFLFESIDIWSQFDLNIIIHLPVYLGFIGLAFAMIGVLISVTSRRLHDLGIKAWAQLLPGIIVSIIGTFFDKSIARDLIMVTINLGFIVMLCFARGESYYRHINKI